MCLAYLFKQLHEQNLSPPLHLTAFIIDHRARPESTAEALDVAGMLRQIGNLHLDRRHLHSLLITHRRSRL
jgi:tRNA(Ile)-lysidine synthase